MSFLTMIVAASLLPSAQVTTVEQDLSWIGDKLGKKVAAQTSLSKKRLFISNPNIPPEKLLNLIATAVHGSVRATASGLVVLRSTSDLKTLREAEHKERADWIRSRLQTIADYRKKASPARGNSAEVLARELQAKLAAVMSFRSHLGPRPGSLFPAQLLPGELLIEDLIQRIGIDEIAEIPANRTVIYEDLPVDSARRLPPCTDLVDEYMKAVQPYETMSLSPEAAQAIENLQYGAYFPSFGKPSKRPERLRLRVKVTGVNQLFELEGFDGEENRVLLADFVTAGSMKSRVYVNVASDEMSKPDARWSPISVDTQKAVDDLKHGMARNGSAPEWLSRPEQSEPLNAFVAGCLQAFAGQTPDKCMIVDVDDFFWEFSGPCCRGQKLCTTAFQDELDEIEDYEKVEDGTSIVLRPRTPEAVEAAAVDRKLLGSSMRDLIGQRGERLRTLSVLCHDGSAARSVLAELFSRYAMRIAPSNSDGFLGDETYRLLGGIPEDAWNELKAGRPATISQAGVTDEMRSLLVSESRQAVGPPVTDLKRHPVELFDRNPVDAASISVEIRSAMVVRWQEAGKSLSPWQPLTRLSATAPQAIDRLATGSFIAVGTQDSFEQALGRGRQFQFASEGVQLITIHLPYGQSMQIVGSLDVHDPGSLSAYSDLPQTMRDKIWQGAIELQKRQLGMLAAHPADNQQPPGRKVPPP